MEELLNKLIQRGWKPFGDENVKEIKIYSDMDMECIYGKRKSDFYYFSPRKITSKESGLWQFVCENGLLNVNKKYEWEYWTQSYKRNGEEYTHEFSRWCENYRIIESALCDEEYLEKFLLENIKIS